MRPKRSRAAGIQATLLAAVVAAGAAAAVVQHHRPLDRARLAIAAGTLRSQSAETAELIRAALGERLAPVFTRTHARQLAEKVADVDAALQGATAEPAVRAALAVARDIAPALQRVLAAIAADERAAAANADAARALAARSAALAQALQPGQ